MKSAFIQTVWMFTARRSAAAAKQHESQLRTNRCFDDTTIRHELEMNPVCQPVQFPSSGWITTAPLHGGPEDTASCWLIIKQHPLLQRDSMSQFCSNYAGLPETAANAGRSQFGERCARDIGALDCFVATRRATSHVGRQRGSIRLRLK